MAENFFQETFKEWQFWSNGLVQYVKVSYWKIGLGLD